MNNFTEEQEKSKKRTVYDDIRDGINVEKYQIDYSTTTESQNEYKRVKPRMKKTSKTRNFFGILFILASLSVGLGICVLNGHV